MIRADRFFTILAIGLGILIAIGAVLDAVSQSRSDYVRTTGETP